MTRLDVIAIIAAYNEADIIGQVIADYIGQGIGVWLIDHDSTDGTRAAAEPYLGRGLHHIEAFPPPGGDAGDANRYPWTALLRRKEALAAELDAAWFIHADADEFRESPWENVPLREAIEIVDAAGYNAIDAARWDFWPVSEGPPAAGDIREALRFCEPAPPTDRLQIRCWKKSQEPVDLAGSGGHEVRFPGRHVFPIRFLIRHYPIRSQAHGERKVFVERRPRYMPDERSRGWHVQYDALREGASFVRDPAGLAPWNPRAARRDVQLHHRGVEALTSELEQVRGAIDVRERLEAELRTVQAERAALAVEAARARAELQHAESRLAAMRGSKSWRWTAPLRAAYRAVTGRPA